MLTDMTNSGLRIFWRLVSLTKRRNIRKYALLFALGTLVFLGFITKTSDYLRCPTSSQGAEGVIEALDFSQHRVRFDSSLRYAIAEFAIVGDNWKSEPPNRSPCMATQGSVTYLHHLLPLARRWQGLVSVAVLVPDVDFWLTVLHIENMRRCHSKVFSNVSFHFVYPLDHPPVFSSESNLLDIDDCSAGNLDVSNRTRFNASAILYPQNLMRNVASKTCPTKHVLVSDIDMIPSLGLAPQIGYFLQTNVSHCPKCAYIIPAYEVSQNETVPGNKSELLHLVRRKKARPYRQLAFSLNQATTNATRWQQHPEGGPLGIAYGLPCFKFFYEPFYLAGGPVPPFDERFVGYGFTRNTQVYETQLAGFRFFVLNNAFLVQHEMVTNPYAADSPGRKMQVKRNSQFYENLKKEFSVKYNTIDKLPCASSD